MRSVLKRWQTAVIWSFGMFVGGALGQKWSHHHPLSGWVSGLGVGFTYTVLLAFLFHGHNAYGE